MGNVYDVVFCLQVSAVDTVGAGDSFLATLLDSLLDGKAQEVEETPAHMPKTSPRPGPTSIPCDCEKPFRISYVCSSSSSSSSSSSTNKQTPQCQG